MKAANECVAQFRWNNDNRWHLFVARTIQAERERDGWQTMETAPKDGTEILLYREDCGVMLGRWIACCEFIADGDPGNDFCPEGNDEAWEEPDWFGADFIQGYRITNDGAPTHWQPLPTPPETEREAME